MQATILWEVSTCGEMDITTVFGTVIPGSSPGGWTCMKKHDLSCFFMSEAGMF